MNVNLILEPKKTLKFDTIEIDLQGLKPDAEMFVEFIKYKKYNTQAEVDAANRLYVKRMICCMIKEVRGLSVNGHPFKVELETIDGIEIMKPACYDILMQVFHKKLKMDLISPIDEFYKSSLDGEELIEIQEEKEEDKKKV